MATTSFDSVYRFGMTNIAIGIGATIAQWMAPTGGQIGWLLAPASIGGTFEIYPAALTSAAGTSNAIGTYPYANGTTQTQAVLAGFSGQGFYVGGASGALQANFPIPGPAQFYIGNSSGATVFVKVLSWFGQGI